MRCRASIWGPHPVQLNWPHCSMRDPTCTPTSSEPEAKIQVQCLPECSSFREPALWSAHPSGCFLALRNRAGGGRWRGEQQGPPQANQGCSTGRKVLGAVLGDRECAEPDTAPPVTQGCWPSCPQRPLSQDLPRTQSHCFPTALDPSVPAHSSCGGPSLLLPSLMSQRTHRAPVSRGHPISRQACV